MSRSFNSAPVSRPSLEGKLSGIRRKLASAMIGSTVDLLADSKTVAHGIVSGVFLKAGTPKIIVNGQSYDMDRVITATSASI
jgi:hypothetical protein